MKYKDMESSTCVRSALKSLMVDETEAVEGYDKVLALAISDDTRAKLEHIRNEEVVHISELSDMYSNVSGDGLQDNAIGQKAEDELLKLELQKREVDSSISSLGDMIDRESSYKDTGSIRSALNSLYVKRTELNSRINILLKTGIKSVLGDTDYKYETDKTDIKWRMHQAKSGSYYFQAPDGTVYEENGREVRFDAKQVAGEFFIRKLFNKSLWGFEVPKVVIDSVVADIAAAPGTVVKCDGGYCIATDKNGWLMFSSNHTGAFRFGSTVAESRTVFKTGEEALKVAKEFLNAVYEI